MIINKALLRVIDFDDIQLLRYWRNLDDVRNRMLAKDFVGRDAQRKWFEGLNSNFSAYFIYSLDSQDIGCVNLTKISEANKTFEGGIFCGNPLFFKHWINVWACVKLYNHAFFELGLDTAFATILKNNSSALSLNKSLGYEPIEGSDENVGRFILTRDGYSKATYKIQKYLRDFASQTL
ncbi:MAG: GNAT family N-acetyltransferase [Gammaproteobacteria bacterium]|nr:GNAT family N-acetyltransferase [Gammaproteobacteria bacterium]